MEKCNSYAEELLAHGFENILYYNSKKMGEVDFLCNDNLSIEGDIKYLPIYMIMFIYKEEPANVQFSLDLSGLS